MLQDNYPWHTSKPLNVSYKNTIVLELPGQYLDLKSNDLL